MEFGRLFVVGVSLQCVGIAAMLKIISTATVVKQM